MKNMFNYEINKIKYTCILHMILLKKYIFILLKTYMLFYIHITFLSYHFLLSYFFSSYFLSSHFLHSSK